MIERRSLFLISCLLFGYAFLYIPIFMVIVHSFNDSRIMSVWNGFSFRWYIELFNNEQIIEAALLSIRIAFVSATVATLLHPAGFALLTWGSCRQTSFPALS